MIGTCTLCYSLTEKGNIKCLLLLHYDYDLCSKTLKLRLFFLKNENKNKIYDTQPKGDVWIRHYTNVMKLGKISNSCNVTLMLYSWSFKQAERLKRNKNFICSLNFLITSKVLKCELKHGIKLQNIVWVKPMMFSLEN